MTAIRPATPADAPALAELRWEFRAAIEPPEEAHETFVARCASWMAAELGAGRPWRALVAEDGGRIVGQIWIHTIGKLPNPVGERATHAYISNLYVTPGARGGAGTRLLQAVVDRAAAEGVDRVVPVAVGAQPHALRAVRLHDERRGDGAPVPMTPRTHAAIVR